MGFLHETSSLVVHSHFAVFGHHYLYCCGWQRSWKYNLLYAQTMSKAKLWLPCGVKEDIHSLTLCPWLWRHTKLAMMCSFKFQNGCVGGRKVSNAANAFQKSFWSQSSRSRQNETLPLGTGGGWGCCFVLKHCGGKEKRDAFQCHGLHITSGKTDKV